MGSFCIVGGSPRMCIRHTATSEAATARSTLRFGQRHVVDHARPHRRCRATAGLLVSTETIVPDRCEPLHDRDHTSVPLLLPPASRRGRRLPPTSISAAPSSSIAIAAANRRLHIERRPAEIVHRRRTSRA
jgi:hypothetical protein